MYTIDMCENHRPIPDCMMKNTLKDVIELVFTSPSVHLDTSDENLKRVWAIKHPDKANKELRKKAQVRWQAEATLQQSTDAVALSRGDVIEIDPVETDEVEEIVGYFEGISCNICGKESATAMKLWRIKGHCDISGLNRIQVSTDPPECLW